MAIKMNQVDESADLLAEAVDSLWRCGCQFWACEGFEATPEDQVTCHRCWTRHEIFSARPELKRKYARAA